MAGLLRRRQRVQPARERVIAEKNGARLLERDGKLRCQCPFACSAAYEPCEFSGKTIEEHLDLPPYKGNR